jgi:hypothetical protein
VVVVVLLVVVKHRLELWNEDPFVITASGNRKGTTVLHSLKQSTLMNAFFFTLCIELDVGSTNFLVSPNKKTR